MWNREEFSLSAIAAYLTRMKEYPDIYHHWKEQHHKTKPLESPAYCRRLENCKACNNIFLLLSSQMQRFCWEGRGRRKRYEGRSTCWISFSSYSVQILGLSGGIRVFFWEGTQWSLSMDWKSWCSWQMENGLLTSESYFYYSCFRDQQIRKKTNNWKSKTETTKKQQLKEQL